MKFEGNEGENKTSNETMVFDLDFVTMKRLQMEL